MGEPDSIRERCGPYWAEHPSPSQELTEACIAYWLQISYGTDDPEELMYDPEVGRAEELDVTAAQLSKMVAHVDRVSPSDASSPHPTVRARQYFQAAARLRFSIGQGLNLLSFEPQLRKVLAGERLTDEDLAPYGVELNAITRWRLAAAVRARHGIVPDHPDLQRFLYEPGSVSGVELLPIPREEGGAESSLTEEDRHNLRVLGQG